jgi:DNA-binding response OmpR family regulator
MFLEKEGYEVRLFESGDKLYEAFVYKRCGLVIIDIDAPGSDGFIICAKIKQLADLPVIVITGQESDEHYIFSITMGIDTCLTKPLSHIKLIAHIRALLIKANHVKVNGLPATGPTAPQQDNDAELSYADTTVHRGKRIIFCGNNGLQLTHKEYRLLLFMIENQGRAISREELFNTIWGEKNVTIRVTDDTIKRVRKKLAEANSIITIDTMWGFGFRLNIQSDDVACGAGRPR